MENSVVEIIGQWYAQWNHLSCRQYLFRHAEFTVFAVENENKQTNYWPWRNIAQNMITAKHGVYNRFDFGRFSSALKTAKKKHRNNEQQKSVCVCGESALCTRLMPVSFTPAWKTWPDHIIHALLLLRVSFSTLYENNMITCGEHTLIEHAAVIRVREQQIVVHHAAQYERCWRKMHQENITF